MTLNSGTANYRQPATGAITTRATFKCAWDVAALYVSGIITDSVVTSSTGGVYAQDSAVIGIDGRGDGQNRPLQDEHQIAITAANKVMDMMVYPVVHTSAVVVSGAGWTFEIRIPRAVIAWPMGEGGIIGLTWELYDKDTGDRYWSGHLVSDKFAGRELP